MSLVSTIAKFRHAGAARRFDAAAASTRKTQLDLLTTILRRNAGTEYGRRHDFAGIGGLEDYRAKVPVVTYEDISADMTRVTEGERNVFTAEDPVMFARTSGTTGEPKFIPVTPSDRGRAHSDVMKTWWYHAQCAHPDLFDGKIVSLVSPAVEGRTSSGLVFGSTSGHLYKNQPKMVRRMYAVPYEVFELSDYEAKYYGIMRTSVAEDVRFLATANPSSILKMCEKGNEFSEQIIRDVRDGTLSAEFEIEPELRPAIESGLRQNPEAARRLEAARRKRDGVLQPVDYWPRLSLIGCWKGGTVGHYLEKFDAWFDPDGNRVVPVRDWGYLSSECRGSIPLSDKGSKGALTVASSVFEFVPVADLEANPDDRRAWPFVTADGLDSGGEYYIFVTTTSGLYRYDINDVVRVEGEHRETPEIAFVRKGRGMTNITGEKLSVNQVIDAMQTVSRNTGALPAHFKAEADPDNSRYIFRVEFASKADSPRLRRFLAGLDDYLQRVNIEYKAKRDSGRLEAPVLHVMREGWYERSRRAAVREGKRAFQAKTELLSPSRQETAQVRPELEAVIEMEG